MYNSVFNLDFGRSTCWYEIINSGTENKRSLSVPYSLWGPSYECIDHVDVRRFHLVQTNRRIEPLLYYKNSNLKKYRNIKKYKKIKIFSYTFVMQCMILTSEFRVLLSGTMTVMVIYCLCITRIHYSDTLTIVHYCLFIVHGLAVNLSWYHTVWMMILLTLLFHVCTQRVSSHSCCSTRSAESSVSVDRLVQRSHGSVSGIQ